MRRDQSPARTPGSADGFSLIEVMIAMLILAVGVLSLVGVMAICLQTVGSSSAMLIAREKAREAIESVHSERDTGELAWSRVRNVSSGGSFLDGMQDIRTAGNDGLVNTADDGAIEVLRAPGPDGLLNTADDILTPLGHEQFQRQISITSVNLDGTSVVNQNLRQITVTVRYRVLNVWRVYTVSTFVSAYSSIMPIAPSARPSRSSAGYSLIELLIAMGLTTVVIGATLAGLGEATKANDAVVQITTMNDSLRTAMDLMFRDLLQTGAGLPKGHVIQTPSGGTLIRRPGPPGTAYTNQAGDLQIPAVIPGPGLGPIINGVATDMITILAADNNFTDVGLTAVSSTSVTVPGSVNIGTGMDRVIPGQLMMVLKGSSSTLVQVTAVNAGTGVISFAAGDSLNLNQPGTGIAGNLRSLNAQAPTGAAAPAATRITRVRLIAYYLDNTTSPGRPRLVRRVNNGDPTQFDNTLGTAVAFDVENLLFTYDINDGANNPSNVRFVAADLTASGACAPAPCSQTQIRKVNVTLAARSPNATVPHARSYRNTLTSEVALRGMALVNEYQD